MTYEVAQDFDWSDIDPSFISWEVFEHRIYDRRNKVKPGDIVVDIGSNCGAFSYTAALNGAKKIYLVEPSKQLLKSAIRNMSEFMINNEDRFVFLNYAITSSTNFNLTTLNGIVHGSDKTYDTETFKNLIDRYNISRIDFLKIDCEGGEYDIFTEDNIKYLSNNVKFIVTEFHGRSIENGISKFFYFRDNYLKHFVNYVAMSGDGKIWNSHMFNDETIYNVLNNTELMIYMQN